jgi:predicted flap endonuclease-1-like 5' DNA nuclease
MSRDDDLNSDGNGPGQSAGDANDQITEQVEERTGEDINVEETLGNNKDQRSDFENEFTATSEDVANNIEEGAETEGNAIRAMAKRALGLGSDNKDAQDEIKASAEKFREMAGARKAHYETEFGEREENVSIDKENLESEYGSFKSQFGLALDETLPMAYERDQLLKQEKNRSRVRSAKGTEDNPTAQNEMEETGDLWLFAEDEAEGAKDQANESIENVLEEINLEGQAVELQDRKETYEEVDSIVETAIENVQEADDEVSIDDMEEAIHEAAEEYGLDISDDIPEETIEAVAGHSRDYIDDVAEELGVEDQVVSSVTTDIREFYDEEEVDPIEAAQHLRATVADAYERQAERFSTAADAVEKIEEDLHDTLENYDTFTSKAEDLTNVEGVGNSVAEDLSDADIETVFDLANASQRRFERMTDSAQTSGDNAESLKEEAQSYIETELAHELGLEDLTEQMEDTLQAGEATSVQYAIKEQAEAAYESIDTVERYVNGLLENNLPDSTDVALDDDEYSAEEAVELASGEREEAYEELGLSATDLDEIGHVEDSQVIKYEE